MLSLLALFTAIIGYSWFNTDSRVSCDTPHRKSPTELNLIHIRPSSLADFHAIAELNRQAFERESEAKLVELIRYSDRYIPELELVAELKSAVVGHILFSYIDLQRFSDE